MSKFIVAPPPTYAQEQLSHHLGALATLPVQLPSDAIAKEEDEGTVPSHRLPTEHLQSALKELTQVKPPSEKRLVSILQTLSGDDLKQSSLSDVDRAAEAEILTRAVSMIWSYVMQTFVDGALKLEDDRAYWEVALSTRTGTIKYLIQTLPDRIYKAVLKGLKEAEKRVNPKNRKELWASFHWPTRGAFFRGLHGPTGTAMTLQLSSFSSPLQLTRREMLSNRRSLTIARDASALRVGILATQAPRWDVHTSSAVTTTDLVGETTRVYDVVLDVLDVSGEAKDRPFDITTADATPKLATAGKVEKYTYDAQAPQADPQALLAILQTHLPRAKQGLNGALTEYGRPSTLERLWFPLLFLPPALYFGATLVGRNKAWIREQIENAKETARGFVVQWVFEPVEDIIKTMRGGGEGLGVAPETVKTDQESLERMVMALGKDYYHLSGSSLEELKRQVESGNMSLVLKAYEKEMTHPIKNALMGNLIRTLLIQVQKTKTDLSLALEQLDQLIRSQQLTFAFVGVAPSVLVLWGVWNQLSKALSGENRGKGRKKRYFFGMRNVERILITSPEEDARLDNRDRGLLIVSVSGLRMWAVGLRSSIRQNFLDDLRMVEDPRLARNDKLHVVDRIWRCWGLDGRRRVV